MRKINKQIAAISLGAVAITGTGVAYAYWTTSGSGSGTAATSAGVTNTIRFAPTLNAAGAAIGNLAPGVAAQSFTSVVTNNATEAAYVTDIKAYLTVTKGSNAPAGTCDATDYKLGTSATNVVEAQVMPATYDATKAAALTWTSQDLDPSEAESRNVTGFVQFNNKATGQDACKGATVTINYVAS